MFVLHAQYANFGGMYMLFSSLSLLLTEKYPGTVSAFPLDCELSDVVITESSATEPLPDKLGIYDKAQLTDDFPIPLCLFCAGFPSQQIIDRLSDNGTNYIIVPDDVSNEAIVFILSLFQNTLEQQKLYADLMYMLASDEDLGIVFSEFSKRSECQMLAIDISGKVLAHSTPFLVDHPHWQHSVQVGYLDNYLIEYILSYRDKHNLLVHTKPFIVYCNRLKMYIKAIRVMTNMEIVGYIFMGCHSGAFPHFSDTFMELLSKKLLNSLINRKNYPSAHFNLYHNILTDIIYGATEDEIARRIATAKISFPPNMRVIILQTNYFAGNKYLQDTLIPRLSAVFPDVPKLLKDGALITFFEVNEAGDLPSEVYQNLLKLANDNKVLVGISNVFQDPGDLYSHYQQAVQVLSIARRSTDRQRVYIFSDYAFYVLIDSIDDKSILAHCLHPILPKLEVYDAEKNTELYETLKVYVQTGYSKNLTADLMFLHRNTVNYRIQQITDLFDLDFSDHTLLFKLQYSFYIDSYLKNRYISMTPHSKQQ